MDSDAAPDRRPEPEQATAEQYRQRAIMLADLGRYDEATEELASGAALAPDDPELLTTLARVRLAAGQPDEALAAATAAATAAPDAVGPRVVRGLALLDLDRFAEAAQLGGELLRGGDADAYALLSGAAILGASRNGQESLNGAWRAVQLAPDDARTHLVLAVVAARLRLFDLAERAYQEALRLDPGLADVADDEGVVRLEQRRLVRALGELADAAVLPDAPATAPAEPAPHPGAGPPRRRATDPRPEAVDDAVRRLVLYGGGYAFVAALVAALIAGADSGASRAWAALVAVGGLLVVFVLARRLPGAAREVFPQVRRRDRALAVAGYATLTAPLLILLYAVLGGPWPLVLAIAVTVAAELIVLTRRDRHY